MEKSTGPSKPTISLNMIERQTLRWRWCCDEFIPMIEVVCNRFLPGHLRQGPTLMKS